MSINVTIDGGQILFGLAAVLAAIVGPFFSYRASKAKIDTVIQKVDAVAVVADLTHQSTNSKMDALLAATAKGSLAEGVVQGRAEAAAEQGASALAVKTERDKAP